MLLGKYFHFIAGGGNDEQYHDEIYKYENGEWTIAGNMKTKKYFHSVSIVKGEDFKNFCL